MKNSEKIMELLTEAVEMIKEDDEYVYTELKNVLDSKSLNIEKKCMYIFNISDEYGLVEEGLYGIQKDSRSEYNNKLVKVDELLES